DRHGPELSPRRRHVPAGPGGRRGDRPPQNPPLDRSRW
ncbi:MAG: hypothetical protein AVDCRST_MAG64-2762, partial [uncultured Phycisphaerae bacterium]